jgi:hypothetical protein
MTPIERLDLEERFVQLGADALMRRHPHAAWLVEKGRTRPIPLKDRALAAACARLAAWLKEHGD